MLIKLSGQNGSLGRSWTLRLQNVYPFRVVISMALVFATRGRSPIFIPITKTVQKLQGDEALVARNPAPVGHSVHSQVAQNPLSESKLNQLYAQLCRWWRTILPTTRLNRSHGLNELRFLEVLYVIFASIAGSESQKLNYKTSKKEELIVVSLVREGSVLGGTTSVWKYAPYIGSGDTSKDFHSVWIK